MNDYTSMWEDMDFGRQTGKSSAAESDSTKRAGNFGRESGRPGAAAGGAARSAPAGEREKLMQDALKSSRLHLFGGTLFHYNTPGGTPRVGFAVVDQTEDEVQAMAARYERLCNPYHGFMAFEGVTRLPDCHVYSFQVYGSSVSVYQEVHEGEKEPGREVIDSELLLRQLAQTILCYSSGSERDYRALNCICPHTVFVLRDLPGGPRAVILPIITPAGSGDRLPTEIPNDSKPDITSDLYAACMLVTEVWSGGFLCDSASITVPNSELIRDTLSPIAASRPTMNEFAAQLELTRLPPRRPVSRPGKNFPGKKMTVGRERRGVLGWLAHLFSSLAARVKDSDLARDARQRSERSWREV